MTTLARLFVIKSSYTRACNQEYSEQSLVRSHAASGKAIDAVLEFLNVWNFWCSKNSSTCNLKDLQPLHTTNSMNNHSFVYRYFMLSGDLRGCLLG